MAAKDFEIAAENSFDHDEEEILEFTLPDKEGKKVIYETQYADEGSVGLFMSRTQGGIGRMFYAVDEFMRANFVPATYSEIIARISDRKDPLTLTAMVDVISYIIEESAESTPTEGSPTSTSSPSKTGSGSRANTRARGSNSSSARRAGSSA